MKNSYIVVSINENEKNYAYAVKVNSSDNLLSKLQIKDIKTANICESRKEASKLADYWNECYKKNGTYMF